MCEVIGDIQNKLDGFYDGLQDNISDELGKLKCATTKILKNKKYREYHKASTMSRSDSEQPVGLI